jgi:hypothetical protein
MNGPEGKDQRALRDLLRRGAQVLKRQQTQLAPSSLRLPGSFKFGTLEDRHIALIDGKIRSNLEKIEQLMSMPRKKNLRHTVVDLLSRVWEGLEQLKRYDPQHEAIRSIVAYTENKLIALQDMPSSLRGWKSFKDLIGAIRHQIYLLSSRFSENQNEKSDHAPTN